MGLQSGGWWPRQCTCTSPTLRGTGRVDGRLTTVMSIERYVVGRVVSVNVGQPRTVEWVGRTVTTSIWKHAVEGRVAVRGVNVDGDAQADRRVHGGEDKAVYAYAAEDYTWWSEGLSRELTPGTFGENITTHGIDLSEAVVGQRWRIADTLLEVSQPRLPCFKLGMRMGDHEFAGRFEAARRYGTYLRIIEQGGIGAGDEIEVFDPPQHALTTTEIGAGYPHPDSELIKRMLSVPELPESWRSWAGRARRWAG